MDIQEFTKLLKNLPKECEWVELKKNNSNSIDKILCHAYVIIEWFCACKLLIISSSFMSCLCHYQHDYIDY
jgi:hypothetical protein